jgi:VWFA-related protein
MRHRWGLLFAGLIGSALVTSVPGRAQQPAARADGTVSTGVRAVLVDVVVRDRQGQPVRDLKQSDFEILEDGIAQTVGSFRPVFEFAPAGTAASAAAKPAAPATPATTPVPAGPSATDPLGPPVTALLFDRLTPEARQLAVTAAKDYVGTAAEAPHQMGVFGIDLSLKPYSTFTRDTAVLQSALESIEKRASASFGLDDEQMSSARQRAQASATAADNAVGGAGAGGSQGIGSSPGAAELDAMQQRMMTTFEALERDQSGYTFTNSLFTLVSTMRGMKGRKSIILFSEGVAIPPAVLRLFEGVIDAANRANVSIYTMDAAGLRTESEQRKIGTQVNNAGADALRRQTARTGAVNAPLMKDLELNEDVLRQDPATGLGDLAFSTGGQRFDSTNSLRRGFERVDSDLRNYYLLGYTPTNDAYDGKFRTISVRVKRSGVTIAARKGYFAVRDTGGAPVNTWEAPALGLAEKRPVPNAFPVRAAALSFPATRPAGDPVALVPVLVQLKTAPLTFVPNPDQQTFKSDFAVVVRFLGPDNDVVRKVGQHYEMSGPMAELQRAKNSEVIFYREPELPPGVYTMETIAYDHLSGKGSVRYATVEVPKVDPAKLRVSGLLLVDRAEKVGPDEPRDGPLYVNDVLVYPNLGAPVAKSAKELGFYFTVYPGTASRDRPEAALELLQNGKLLAKVPLELAAADAAGRIQQIGRLPVEALPPGTYELRVAVKQGSQSMFGSTLFQLTP